MKNTIKFHQVSKRYFIQGDKTIKDIIPNLIHGKRWAKQHQVFTNLSFEIDRGETVGIVGKNGAGKSTLMKLIAGVTYPTKGRVSISGRVAPLIELGAGFHHELTGYENIFLNAAILGMHKYEIEAKISQIINFSELEEFINVPVKQYSTGMYMRLGFSVAIHTEADIFLIDEVLAVGDAKFKEKCLKRLEEIKRDENKTILFVSHDQEAVTSFCDRAILLHQGKIVLDSTPKRVFQKYQQVTLD